MRLRKWVRITLAIIMLISMLIMGAEVSDLKSFILSKIIACGMFVLASSVLLKYGQKN